MGLEVYLVRYFRTVKQKVINSAITDDVLIQSILNKKSEKAEEGYQIALSRAVSSDNDIQLPQFEIFQILN